MVLCSSPERQKTDCNWADGHKYSNLYWKNYKCSAGVTTCSAGESGNGRTAQRRDRSFVHPSVLLMRCQASAWRVRTIFPSLFGPRTFTTDRQQVQTQIVSNKSFLKRPQINGCSTCEYWERRPKRDVNSRRTDVKLEMVVLYNSATLILHVEKQTQNVAEVN